MNRSYRTGDSQAIRRRLHSVSLCWLAQRHRFVGEGRLPSPKSHRGWTDESDPVTRANPTAQYGVVTLHRAQKELLDQLMEKARSDRRIPPGVDCLVGTVDTFQGSERDHVFYNIASDMSDENRAAWAEDPRRVNVAVTRAKQSLTIVADLAAIRATGTLLAQLVHHADVCNDLRRTNRGAHELYAWMLIDGIPLIADPECAPDEETGRLNRSSQQPA